MSREHTLSLRSLHRSGQVLQTTGDGSACTLLLSHAHTQNSSGFLYTSQPAMALSACMVCNVQSTACASETPSRWSLHGHVHHCWDTCKM